MREELYSFDHAESSTKGLLCEINKLALGDLILASTT